MPPLLFNINRCKSTRSPNSKIYRSPLTNKPNNQCTKAQGFSLIELMITIAVVSIALTIALPSLGSFTAQMRVDNKVTELQRLLLTTRNAAINSGQNATLCPLKADDSCKNTTKWTGRIGIVSIDGLIKEREAIKTGDKLDFSFNGVTYNPSGQLNNNNIGVFSYCPKGYIDYSRGVDLSLAGRAYLSSDINGDGIEQDRNGKKIECQ